MESAVIGIAHFDLGEVVVAIIVPKKNSNTKLEKIGNTLKKTLAKFKLPRKFFLRDKLPRNSMGKVQKNLLREELNDYFIKLKS